MEPLILPSLSRLREILERAALFARSSFKSGEPVLRKENGTIVTEVDIQTNKYLERELSRLFPKAAWLSEESRDEPSRLCSEWVWVVDPLDGTKEFIRGVPEFAVSIGLVHHDDPVMGGVINPVTGEGGIGHVGGDALFWNVCDAKVTAKRLDTAMASVSRSECEDSTVRPYLTLVGETRPIGSIAYKLLRVAAGLDDLSFSVQPKSEWDVCGGVALIKAVDKIYQRLDGQVVRFNQRDTRIRSGAVAGDQHLVSQFLHALAESGRCGTEAM